MRSKIIYVLLLIILSSSNVLSQDNSQYLKVLISNTDPELNEVITIKADCTAPFDLDAAVVDFVICDENQYTHGINIVKGEQYWHGKAKGGQIFSKEISVMFTRQKVFTCGITFRLSTNHEGFNELRRIYVGGAFEEDARVKKYRNAIQWYKEELITPHGNNFPFPPDTTMDYWEREENMKDFTADDAAQIKKVTRRFTKENEKKNDKLLIELRKELEEIKRQLHLKEIQQRLKNVKDTPAVVPGFY